MSLSVANTATNSLANRPSNFTRQSDQQISLIDKTVTSTNEEDGSQTTDEDVLSSVERSLSDPTLRRRWTKTSLQQQLAQRKYARYQEDRLIERDEPEGWDSSGVQQVERAGTFDRSKGRVRGLLRKKRLRQTREEDAVIDILYENQRGLFTFGIPHFSSNSLLNFDPKPWTNSLKRTSPVNITNAQVPDPNWEWAWKSWYVDMSRDVDEDGWEYSLYFYGSAWHGNHPWFHSFVRRRRWLRKRVRKSAHHGKGEAPGQKHIVEAHMLTPEYFTIHPTTTHSTDDSRAPSVAPSTGTQLRARGIEGDIGSINDIQDIATLLTYLRRAAVDREKLVLVRNFVSHASEELYYLQEQVSHPLNYQTP